jgi:predicted metal-dependent hydrolase
MTAVANQQVPQRDVNVRRVDFGFDEHRIQHHFANGDPVMSHLLAMLSGLFPAGEDFFVRSVRAYRDQITDPELKRQVRAFIGQEAIHGREHRHLNECLAALGYRTGAIDRFVNWQFKVSERFPGRSRRLAVTAALEHYTATLAGVLLTDERARNMVDPEIRDLFLWHALEECEHKSVAFDVYQHVSGNDRVRRIVMNTTTVGFIGVTVVWTTASLVSDPETWRHPMRVLRGLAALRRSPWLTAAVWRQLRDYNRPDFHPDQHDSAAVLERWKVALFGDGGSLSDLLDPPAVAS